jgi:hypothetical protein
MAYTNSNIAWTPGTWYYFVGVWNGTYLQMYVNGEPNGTAVSQTYNGVGNSAFNAQVGCGFATGCDSSTNAVYGVEDEVRISNVARTPQWIATEYNNTYHPDLFISVGNKVGSPCKPTFIQSQRAESSGSQSTLTLTFDKPTTAGNLVVVGIEVDSNSPPRSVQTVKDDNGDSFSYAIGSQWGTGNASTYYLANIPAGQTHIYLTLNGSTSNAIEMYGAEYSGIATGSPLDKTSVGTGSGGPGHVINSGSATTTQPSELIFGYYEESGMEAPVLDSPWNQRLTYNGNTIADFTASSTGTYSVTGSVTAFESWIAMMATFKGV